MDAARLRNVVVLEPVRLQQLRNQQRLRQPFKQRLRQRLNHHKGVVVIALQDRFHAQLDASTIARVVHATQSLIVVL